MPGVAFGRQVDHLPEAVGLAYTEARNCMAVNSFTAATLMCRKLLMNVAVLFGAPPIKSFAFYVDYLVDNGYVPTQGRSWVDHIRQGGNEAAHEIPPINRADAEEVLTFTEMLLQITFEYPAKAKKNSD